MTHAQKIQVSMPPRLGVYMTHRKQHRNRYAASILAIFLGILGIHKFYIGNYKVGFIQLLAFAIASLLSSSINIYLPVSILGIISCVEAILYLFKTDEEFNKRYIVEKRAFL